MDKKRIVPQLKQLFRRKEYELFDWCADLEEAEAVLKELRAAGYLARRTDAIEGYRIWAAKK